MLRPATGLQTSPAVGASGSDFLAAWSDERSVDPMPQSDVYASRLWPGGNLDRSGGVAVSPTSWRDGPAAVVWNGDEYIVINSVALYGSPVGAMFSRVTDDGPQPGTLVSVPVSDRIAAAWNGSVYLVVVGPGQPKRIDLPDQNPGVVRACLVDKSFHLIRAVFDVSDPASDSMLPSVTTDGTSFLVTWLTVQAPTATEVHTALVSPSGEVQRSSTAVASFQQPYAPWAPASATWGGDRYLIAWTDGRSALSRFVDRNATPLSDPITVQPANLEGVGGVSASWNGTMFLVSFDRREAPAPGQYPIPRLYAVRVRPDGIVIDSGDPIPVSNADGNQTLSTIAATAGRFVIVWQNGSDIRAAVLDPDVRAIVADEMVSRSIGRQSDGAGVFDGQNFGFLWSEERDVMFGRMSLGGNLLDGPGRKLGGGIARALLSSGSLYLAVWLDKNAFLATRISFSGEMLDDVPLHLAPGALAFATDGKDFLVLAIQHSVLRDGWHVPHIVAYIVTGTGTVTPPDQLMASDFDQQITGVAWDGMHYVVFYRQYLAENCYRCGHEFDFQDRAVLVDRLGHPVGSPFRTPFGGSVAAGDGRILIASYLWSASDDKYRLTYTVIDENGIVLPPTVLRVDSPTFVDAEWDARAFVILSGATMYRIAPSGELSEERDVVPRRSREVRVIPARGADPLLMRSIVKQQPDSHDGGIERYFLFWPHSGRVRAVSHR